MLQEKLGGLDKNSAEYYDTLKQINDLQTTQADEQAAIAKKAEDEAKRRNDAEWDYQYSIANTAGKLAMLREKLGTVEQGSEDYWRIKQQIADVERQAADEAEKGAKKAIKGKKKTGAAAKKAGADVKAAGATGALSFAKLGEVATNTGSTIDKLKELTDQAKDKWAQVTGKFDEGKTKLAEMRQRASDFVTAIGQSPAGQLFGGIVAGAQEAIGYIQQFAARWQDFQSGETTVNPFQPLIDGALQLIGVLGGIGAAWAVFQYLPTLIGYVRTAWTALQAFNTVLGLIGMVLSGGGWTAGLSLIVGVLGGPWIIALGLAAAAVGAFAYAFTNNLGGARDFLMPIIDNLLVMFQNLRTGIMSGAGFIQPAIDAVIQALTALAPIGAVIVAGLIGVFGGLVNALSVIIPGAIAIFSGAVQIISGVITIVASVVTGVVSAIVALFQGDFAGAGQALLTMFQNIGSGIATVFRGLLTALIGIVTAIVGGIIQFFTGLYQTLVGNSIVPDMVEGIVEWFGRMARQAPELVSRLVTLAIQYFSNLLTQAVQKGSELYTQFTAKVDELKERALTLLLGLLTEGITHLGNLVTRGTEKADAVKNAVIERFGQLKDQALAKVDELKTNAITAVSNIATEVGNLASTFLDKAKSIGGSIIDGIKQGIANGVGALKDAIRNAANDALNAAKQALGISSPSKAFRFGVGRETMVGAALGVDDTAPRLINAAQRAADAMLLPFDNVKEGLSNVLGNVTAAVTANRGALRLAAATGQLQALQGQAIATGVGNLDYKPEYNVPIQVVGGNPDEIRQIIRAMLEENDQRLMLQLESMFGLR
jgi:hypothetical protein